MENSSCPVCKVNFGFFSKKVECSSCKMQVCRDHSVFREQIFCEICEKNKIRSKFFPDLVFQIKNLKSELAYLEKDKKKYKSEIATKNDIISRLDKQYQTNLDLHKEKVALYERKIAQESEKIISEEKLVLFLHQSLTESQKSENAMIEKLNLSMHEVHLAKNEYDEMCSDQKFLIDKLDKLNIELRGYAPINRVGLASCSDCKQRIKNEFLEVFETSTILNGRDSFFSSIIVSPIIDKKSSEGYCRSCGVM